MTATAIITETEVVITSDNTADVIIAATQGLEGPKGDKGDAGENVIFGDAITDDALILLVSGECYQLININRDSDNVITSSDIIWAGGAAGVFTTTVKNNAFLAIDAYTMTYVIDDVDKLVTQPTVTRNSDGAVIVKPELTVA